MARSRWERDQASAPEDRQEGGIPLGQRLKHAREAKGLSLDDVFDKIKLRPPIVEAIEQERWDDLPPPPFVRGFLRTYAKLLEIDEREIIKLYESSIPKDNRPFEAILTKRHAPKTGWAIAIGFIIAVFVFVYWWLGQPPPGTSNHESVPPKKGQVSKEKPRKKAQSTTTAIEEQGTQARMSEQAAPLNPVSEPQEHSDVVSLNDQEPIPLEVEQKTEKRLPLAPKGPNLVLKGLVKERTWIRIKIDGGKAKEYIFDPGTSPIWKAKQVFDIIIGNAGGIDLELNGKPLGALGKSGDVVHLVLPKES